MGGRRIVLTGALWLVMCGVVSAQGTIGYVGPPFADQPLALGATKMGIAVASSVLLRHVAPKRPRLVRWVGLGLVAGYGVIVARNARELR